MAAVPDLRLGLANEAPVNRTRRLVLYWMTTARRVTWNVGLDRAVWWAKRLNLPLVILETLPADRRWDSDRLHRFALDGMADTVRRAGGRAVAYYPYVERKRNDGAGLIAALGRLAAVVVTDRFPCFIWPEVVEQTGARLGVRLEQVDSNGLLPLLAADRVFKTAASFRRFLQRNLPEHLAAPPSRSPLARLHLPVLEGLPREITRRWPKASAGLLAGRAEALAHLPIDHGVGPAAACGGTTAAVRTLRRFLKGRLARYDRGHNHPDDEATSDLSPYLAFGHLSVHQVLAELMAREGWSPEALAPSPTGKREGWWGVDANAEAFLDELITWRELGYNLCDRRDDYHRYGSLPSWARATLAEHATDERPYVYSRAQFEEARTHDPLWNAAQRQLVRDGRLHNYMRMLWGKKILEWSASPEDALETMIDLNNRYALDGRNPNSYTGIFWVLGRYDRAWGPERPVFGKIRYMSSASARRKLRLTLYLKRYAPREEAER